MKKKPKTARRGIIVTDQGCDGQYCSASGCGANVTWKDDICWKCGAILINDGNIGGNFGNYDPNRF